MIDRRAFLTALAAAALPEIRDGQQKDLGGIP